MQRKVARIGPSTLMVSLPSSWVKKHGIEKGQEVTVQEGEGSLIIHSSSHQTKRKRELHVERKDQLLNRYIRSLYQQGVNEVNIVCDEGIDTNHLKKELDLYLGFEIVEQGKKYCTIRNVAETLDNELDTIVRKLFLVDMNMVKESLHAIIRGEVGALREIATIERTNNKLTNFCYRCLNKSGKVPDTKRVQLYTLLFCLENIADHLRDICLSREANQAGLSKDLSSFYETLISHYEELYSLYYKSNKEKMVALRDQRALLTLVGYALFGRVEREEECILHHLLSILHAMKDMELSFDLEEN